MRDEAFRRHDQYRGTVTYAFSFFEVNFYVCDDELHHGQSVLLLVTGRFQFCIIVIFSIEDTHFWLPWQDRNVYSILDLIICPAKDKKPWLHGSPKTSTAIVVAKSPRSPRTCVELQNSMEQALYTGLTKEPRPSRRR